MAFKLKVRNCGKALLRDQLLGRLPPRVAPEKFTVCKAGKLPVTAHEAGKSGSLPVKVRFVSVVNEPRDCHVNKEQLTGRLALME